MITRANSRSWPDGAGHLTGQPGSAQAGLGIGDLHQFGHVGVQGVGDGGEPGCAFGVGGGCRQWRRPGWRLR